MPDEPISEIIPLQTRKFSCFFQTSTGFLRRVKSGGAEVIRAIYGAVRDKNWDTVPATLQIEQLQRGDDSFLLEFTSDHRANAIAFRWKGTIRGRGEVLEFRFDGRAGTTFLRNRIGFCILHPILECAGKECRIQHSAGQWHEEAFPYYISPHQPFKDIKTLSWRPSDRVEATIRFEGEVFEMEDQRNWTDASFKTYCTPLDLPFPVEISADEEVHQEVVLTMSNGVQRVEVAEESGATISLLPDAARRPLPKLGLCVANPHRNLSSDEVRHLERLQLSHLRTDIRFSKNSWKAQLSKAQDEVRAINARLQYALFLGNSADQELRAFAEAVDRTMVESCLIFHEGEKSTASRWLDLAERHLGPFGFRLATGTNAYFTELNRQRPPRQVIACYSFNPQVHTFDDLSLMETLEAQPVTVESALQFCDRELIISPVTLLPRFNPNATDPAQQQEDPASATADPRQSTLFCSAWTTGSLARLLPLDRVESVTYFQTTGPRGIMETQGVAKIDLFPVYYVFEALAAARSLFSLTISQPALVAGLALAKDGGHSTCLIANLTPESIAINLRLPVKNCQALTIDETNLAAARAGQLPSPTVIEASHARLNLRPYAFLRLDF